VQRAPTCLLSQVSPTEVPSRLLTVTGLRWRQCSVDKMSTRITFTNFPSEPGSATNQGLSEGVT
jgi:hypothetical protein